MKYALTYGAGLTAANFLWQLILKHDWGVATERSYFQVMAIVLFWFHTRTLNRQ